MTEAIAQTEHTFYYYDSNGWEFIPYCDILSEYWGSGKVCFVLWKKGKPRRRAIARFNFKHE